MFNSLFKACLALIAAFRIGRWVGSFCPVLWWLASHWSFSHRLGWTGVSPCSVHSRGYKKLSVRFSNFPEAVRTVAALISPSVFKTSSSTTANFQVHRGELSFKSTTSLLVGWLEDCVLGAFKCFWVRSRKLSTYLSNYSFQNAVRCFSSYRWSSLWNPELSSDSC